MTVTESPTVLVIAGLDPSGGAGLIADIQAITTLGAHPAVAASCLTVQNTSNVERVIGVATQDVIDQARSVLADQTVRCIKLGVLPTRELGEAVCKLLDAQPAIPVVVDPVLIASGGGRLSEAALQPLMAGPLARRASVLTPNVPELRALTGETDPDRGARSLLDAGAGAVLVTDGDGDLLGGDRICNRLYGLYGRDAAQPAAEPETEILVQSWEWPRLAPPAGRPASFHGTGCTLASAIAAFLARGFAVEDACDRAQAWLARTLAPPLTPGAGQAIPNRTVLE